MFERIQSRTEGTDTRWSLSLYGARYDGAFIVEHNGTVRTLGYAITITSVQVIDCGQMTIYDNDDWREPIKIRFRYTRQVHESADRKRVFQAKIQGRIQELTDYVLDSEENVLDEVFLYLTDWNGESRESPEQIGYFAHLYNEKYKNV